MTAVPDPGVVDVVFRLKGRTVPTEHAHVLRAAVCEQLPWLEQGTAELVDWFLPFCIAGLSVLGVSLLFLLGWRYTPW